MGADHSFYVKTIETHSRAFLPLNISTACNVEFFCLGHFVSNTYPEKMLKLFMDGRYTITEVLLTRAKHFKITRSILGPLGENNESFRALLI